MTSNRARPLVPPVRTPKPPLDVQAVVLLAQSAHDAFERCVRLALACTRATTSMVVLMRPGGAELEVVAAAGHLAREAVGRRLQRGEALSWRVIEQGAPVRVDDTLTSTDAHFLSGTARPGMYLGVPLLDPDGQILGVLTADTTDSDEHLGDDDAQAMLLLGQAAGVAYSRWRALDDAQRAAQHFEQLARLSAELEQFSQPDDIARHALQTLLRLSGFTTGAAVRLEGQKARLTVLEGEARARSRVEQLLRAPHAPSGVIAQVLRTNSSVVVADYQAHPSARPDAPLLRTALAAPLRAGGQAVGVIGLMNLEQRIDIPPDLPALLDLVAARVDHALERAEALEHLRDTREAALRAVGRVLESRDGETYGHTDRVTSLALQLGEALALPGEALRHLRWGAYLHDIGKVAVPDDILLKPGALTPDERAVMQRHVVVGDDMLRDEAFAPREVRAIVRSHHERWDGRGYPDGLGADGIPLLARIFSVVDVYDALISERPYKRAWTPLEAALELRRSAGTQFDPRIVEVFCAQVLKLPPPEDA